MPSFRGLTAIRARSYLVRLPLFTRVIILAIVVFWIFSFPSLWDLRKWGSLIPDQVTFATGDYSLPITYTPRRIFGYSTEQTIAYRLSTFPLIHLNFIHAAVNLMALTPLLERFENEYGTLTSLALFFGPLTTVPALLYIVIELGILRANNSIMGASIWIFTLLGMEAIRTYRSNPHLVIGTYYIPTWTTPIFMMFVVAVLIPNTSLLGHLCGVAVGYVCGLGYLKFVAPPEWALRWIETRLNLLSVLPHYVSVDQKTYGRFGVLPSANRSGSSAATELVGSTQRLGP